MREPVMVGVHHLATSISCGGAVLAAGHHALHLADEALYAAKHAGRDRHVVLATSREGGQEGGAPNTARAVAISSPSGALSSP